MVLDNASTGGSDDFSDDKPPSDGDLYSTSNSSDANTVSIDVNKYPRRLTVRGLFTQTTNGSDRFLCMSIAERVKHMASILRRTPTHEEADAMGYWTARQLAIQSYGLPIGLAAGSLRTYNSRNSFNFPFFKPDLEKFNASAFPSSRITILTGTMAKQAWHCSRWLAYVVVGNIVAGFFTGAYAMSVVAVGEMSDPRLKNYVEVLRAKAQQRNKRVLPQSDQQVLTSDSQQDDNSPAWKDTDNGEGTVDRAYHDVGSNYAGGGRVGSIDDRTSMEEVAREARQSPRSQKYKNNDSAGTFPMQDQPGTFDSEFDEASSTIGPEDAGTKSAGGSAWDRIRQQASTGRPARPEASGQRTRKPAAAQDWNASEPSSSDSFSFSSSDRDRQTARNEAQKEFDARVERERRGGDFSPGNGDQKRW